MNRRLMNLHAHVKSKILSLLQYVRLLDCRLTKRESLQNVALNIFIHCIFINKFRISFWSHFVIGRVSGRRKLFNFRWLNSKRFGWTLSPWVIVDVIFSKLCGCLGVISTRMLTQVFPGEKEKNLIFSNRRKCQTYFYKKPEKINIWMKT